MPSQPYAVSPQGAISCAEIPYRCGLFFGEALSVTAPFDINQAATLLTTVGTKLTRFGYHAADNQANIISTFNTIAAAGVQIDLSSGDPSAGDLLLATFSAVFPSLTNTQQIISVEGENEISATALGAAATVGATTLTTTIANGTYIIQNDATVYTFSASTGTTCTVSPALKKAHAATDVVSRYPQIVNEALVKRGVLDGFGLGRVQILAPSFYGNSTSSGQTEWGTRAGYLMGLPFSNIDNFHQYGTFDASQGIAQLADSTMVGNGHGTRRKWMTETGIEHSATSGTGSTDEQIGGMYIVREYVFGLGIRGVEKTFVYTLFDDSTGVWGLYKNDGTEKDSGRQVKNFFAILADSGSQIGRPLPIKSSAPYPSVLAVPISHSDGRFFIAFCKVGTTGVISAGLNNSVWGDPAFPTTQAVTFTLPKSFSQINVMRPWVDSTTRTHVASNTNTITLEAFADDGTAPILGATPDIQFLELIP